MKRPQGLELGRQDELSELPTTRPPIPEVGRYEELPELPTILNNWQVTYSLEIISLVFLLIAEVLHKTSQYCQMFFRKEQSNVVYITDFLLQINTNFVEQIGFLTD